MVTEELTKSVDLMALKGMGRLYEHTKGMVVLYLPAAVVKDSAFPFKVGHRVRVRIGAGKVIVEKDE